MSFQADFERFTKTFPLKTKRINGLTFNYRLGGNGEKAIALLVGGLGISDAFYNIFTGLAESFTVLTFDYPAETCRNSVLADGIIEFIRALGLNKVFLIGQSYGGLLAQVIAKRHPENVAGLVLSNTGCLDAEMSEEAKRPMLQMRESLKKSILVSRLLPVFLLRGKLLKMMDKHLQRCTPDEKQYLIDLYKFMFSKLTNRHERNMCSLMIDLENEIDIRKSDYEYLEKKVLLLLSEDDQTFGDLIKQALIEMMPNPVVNTGISGGHLALLLKTDLYVRTVTDFIDHIENTSRLF